MKALTLRIGPRMAEVASYVNRHPGCSMYAAARYVAPTGVPGGKPGIGYGYQTVHRAIAAGIVVTTRHPHVRGRVLLMPPGDPLEIIANALNTR